jgi:hypothetical protein
MEDSGQNFGSAPEEGLQPIHQAISLLIGDGA